MREIKGQLTQNLKDHVANNPVAKADAYPINTFRELMHHVAHLSYLNKDHLLFFRGQSSDHKNKAMASSFYPSIYRGERVSEPELEIRFDVLNSASKRLVDAFKTITAVGANEVRKRKLMQWSILQHYEVCPTPLLDFTQSVRVACSFALLEKETREAFIYIFGLPYITNRVSVNSEHELVNVRLLSICPPDALRPYFQEGYLAGTEEITNDFHSKNELDFNRRLIAKFKIQNNKDFWGGGFDPIPKKALYPDEDKVLILCKEIQQEVGLGIQPSELGGFLQAWSDVESMLFSIARNKKNRVFSASEAINVLNSMEMLPEGMYEQLNKIRNIRNMAVHHPGKLHRGELMQINNEIVQLKNSIKEYTGKYSGS